MEQFDFPIDSKLWVYASNRAFTPTEKLWIEEQMAAFVQDWASHGNQLKAKAELIANRAIVLYVDTNFAASSGCSIDKSVRTIKEIGNQLGVDFFNRLKVWSYVNDSWELVAYAKAISENHVFINPAWTSLSDFISFKQQFQHETLPS